jgi:hypothetical protein
MYTTPVLLPGDSVLAHDDCLEVRCHPPARRIKVGDIVMLRGHGLAHVRRIIPDMKGMGVARFFIELMPRVNTPDKAVKPKPKPTPKPVEMRDEDSDNIGRLEPLPPKAEACIVCKVSIFHTVEDLAASGIVRGNLRPEAEAVTNIGDLIKTTFKYHLENRAGYCPVCYAMKVDKNEARKLSYGDGGAEGVSTWSSGVWALAAKATGR